MTDTTLNFATDEEQDQAGASNVAPVTPSEPTATGPETASETPVEAPETPVEPDSTQPGLDALQAENRALRATVQRLTVAAESGVPPELLTGNSAEELQASADRLNEFARSRATVPDFGAGDRGQSNASDTDPVRNIFTRR